MPISSWTMSSGADATMQIEFIPFVWECLFQLVYVGKVFLFSIQTALSNVENCRIEAAKGIAVIVIGYEDAKDNCNQT